MDYNDTSNYTNKLIYKENICTNGNLENFGCFHNLNVMSWCLFILSFEFKSIFKWPPLETFIEGEKNNVLFYTKAKTSFSHFGNIYKSVQTKHFS